LENLTEKVVQLETGSAPR